VFEEEFDGIILGAGHNSLVLQAYLLREGLKVLSIERRSEPGGGLTTMEDPRNPGFLHNTHSFFHRALDQQPWFREFELDTRGAVYIEPDLNVAVLLEDGRSLEWWTDFDRTVDSIKQFSKKDAATISKWRSAFQPIVEEIIMPENQAPPLPPAQRAEKLERTSTGRLLLEVSKLSPLEFVKQEFESPVVQAGLLFFNGLREVDLRCTGFGHHIPALLASSHKAQMCLGGSANLARALVNVIYSLNGQIWTHSTPRRILIENGRSVGVELVDGRRIRAKKFVVSGLNPQQTFLELIEPALLPLQWRRKAENFQYNLIAPLFSLNLCLKHPPRYFTAENRPELDKAFMVVLGLERLESYTAMVECHQKGSFPPTVMWGCCPTVFDPSQAPPGCHTAFMWQKIPFRLRDLDWDFVKEEHGRRMLDLWQRRAPNLADSIIDWFVRSPVDTERTFPNMKEGDLLIGAFSGGQIGYNRPFPGAGHYRTCIEGLYLCGSCCHPGGNITGLPGYNSAQVILGDLGISRSWESK